VGYKYAFTVFTPSFNRARTLARVYESLKAQTFRDFEWLIVDDGSTDETLALVQGWQNGSDFPIRYIYQQNQGKPTASNRATQEAQGELLLTLDSDDAAVPEALERLKYHWDTIPAGQRDGFSAVSGLCKDQNGKLVGDKFPRDVMDSDSIELAFKYTIRGDKWGFQRTDVFKQFPFPTPPVPNPRFNCESVVYMRLSQKYKTRFVNEIFKVYFIDDGADDHLSTLDPVTMSGLAYYHGYILDELNEWFLRSPWKIFRSAINYCRYSFGMGRGASAQVAALHSSTAKLLAFAALPLGYAASIYKDKRRA
jgi:glycosyltransferase involved in cell wall biosynthesis